MIEIDNKSRKFEIIMVVMTGLGKFILVDWLPLKFWFILFSMIFWLTYLILRSLTKKGILRYWGFTRQYFKSTFLWILPFACLIILGFFIYGKINDSAVISWHIIPVLVLYPLWGVVQQFLIVALVAGNLTDMHGIKFPNVITVFLTSILFSIVHYPSILLMGGTFLLAIFYTAIYLQRKNLWVLGLYHGWLGGLFYFLVLGRDPWAEVFSTI